MKIIKKILKYITILLILFLIVYTILWIYAKCAKKLPIKSANSYYMYDNNDQLFNGANDDWISLNNISDNLIKATIAGEDKNFYHHKGFDYLMFKGLLPYHNNLPKIFF